MTQLTNGFSRTQIEQVVRDILLARLGEQIRAAQSAGGEYLRPACAFDR